MGIVSILVLGILIFVHELGHFLVAKYFKIGVVEFAIGFGPKLFTTIKNGTRYSLRAIPLGGFVRMVGDTPDQLTSDPLNSTEEIEEHERVLLADRSKWFLLKPLFARASVVFAGPLFNFVFAFIVAVACIATYGLEVPTDTPTVGELVPNYPADKAGVKVDDIVVAINGKPITKWPQIKESVEAAGEGPVVMEVLRGTDKGSEKLSFDLRSKETGAEVDYLLGSGQGKKTFMIGVRQKSDVKPATIPQSFIYGAYQVAGLTWMNIKSIQGLVVGIISPDQLGGPISIFREAARSAKKGFEDLMNFMVFLSVSLAVLNLLPIPVLDGGHLFFYLIELIKRKPVSFKAQEYATRVGMALLLLLMIYALRNDIRNLWMS